MGFSLGASLALAQNHTAVAIKDARVITVSGEELPKATVVMRNGLITEVSASASIPADAWVIDGSGLTVYPGFIDAHEHVGYSRPAGARGGRGATRNGKRCRHDHEPQARGPEDRPQTYSYERAADQ